MVGNSQQFKIKVDNKMYDIDREILTGREILEISGHSPAERFRLDMQLRGGKTKKISLSEEVNISLPGLEKFYTIPLGPQEG